jgi:tRNA pseudouridine38-40 synthase
MKDLSHRAAMLVRFGYDGGRFYGLQPQPGLPTAGGALIDRLTAAAGRSPRGMAFAARTDRGVHAVHNIATCWFPADEADVSAISQAMLVEQEDGLVVHEVWRVTPTTHARNVSSGKHYRYVVVDGADVDAANGDHSHAWAVVPCLDVDAMGRAAADLLGTHDFSAVRGGGCSAGTPVKTITRLDISREGSRVTVDVEGDAFLRHMVRNLVGLLVEVGSGWRDPTAMPAVLAAAHRQAAGLMAPAGGLSLIEVVLLPGVGPGHEAGQ